MSTPEPAIDLRSDAVTQPTRVAFSLKDGNAAGVALRARALGVLVNATGEHSLRAVTHLDVTLEQVKRAGERVCEAISS